MSKTAELFVMCSKCYKSRMDTARWVFVGGKWFCEECKNQAEYERSKGDPAVTQQTTHKPAAQPDTRKHLFHGAGSLDPAAVKADLEALLHMAEGIGLVMGSVGCRAALGFAEALVEHSDILGETVSELNAESKRK